MRAVCQRVKRAWVDVAGETIGAINVGLLVYTAVGTGDDESAAAKLAEKLVNLRIFDDANGKMNRSIMDVAGSVLLVPQFTLYGDARKGRRPSFNGAAQQEVAIPLLDHVRDGISSHAVPCATGLFGAEMQVHAQVDGPVTILLDTSGVF